VKAAIVAVVGRPSAGKSTLVNALCGGKVSIVSPVPQTTRNRVRGILTKDDAQIVFIDTPGFHLSEKKINRYMTDLVTSALGDVDFSLYVADGSRPWGEEEQAILDAVRTTGKPVVACLNKKDSAAPGWDGVRRILAEAFPGQPPLEISAKTGEGLDLLKKRLFALCPDGDQL
jgi:GTP-binding protein Era